VARVRDRAAPLRSSSGAFCGYAGTLTETSTISPETEPPEHLRAALERRLAELSMLYESVPVGLALVDSQGRFLRANSRMAAVDGEAVEHHLGRTLREISPEFADVVEPLLIRAQASGRPAHSREVRLPSVSDPEALGSVVLSVHPVHDLDGSLPAFGLVAQDVTERRDLEDRIERLRHLESLGHLAEGVAHDFNNVLTIILGNCGASSDPDSHAAFGAIEEAARRAVSMTGELFSVARPRASAARRCDLSAFLAEIAPVLTRILKPDVRLELDAGDQPANAEVNVVRLTELLMNLASNARDRMPQGGLVRITVSTVDWRSDLVNRMPEAPPAVYARLLVHELERDASAEHQTFCQTGPLHEHAPDPPAFHEVVRRVGGHLRIRARRDEGTTYEFFFPAPAANEIGLAPCRPPAPLARAA
jgi:PAS domain S-box-containing protein